MTRPAPESALLHASCVDWQGRGVLVLGAAGRGKSSLALSLMALGATLVADDQTRITRTDEELVASCPPAVRGRIEARGLGILKAEVCAHTGVALIIDLDLTEDTRLPPLRTRSLLGLERPLLHGSETAHFPAAILQYLKAGRVDPD